MSLNYEDFATVCRCCLLNLGPMKPLFGNCLDRMLTDIMHLQIRINDGLPQQICKRCILKLSTAHTFYLAVKKNQESLEEIYKAAAISPITHARGNNEIEDKLVKETKNTNSVPTVTEKQPEPSIEQYNVDVRFEKEIYSDSEDCYECPQCKHCAKTNEELQLHLQTHQIRPQNIKDEKDAKSVLCNYCGKRFRWRTSLYKHMRLHRGRVYQCKYCDKPFTEASTLKIHLVRHNLQNPKPFHCAVCDRSFTQRSALNKHERLLHATAERERHQCKDCGRNFLQKCTLKLHIARIHAATYCTVCNKQFTGQKALDVHMRIHNSQKLKNKNVKISESVANSLTGPISIQTVTVEFLCLLCNQKFPTNESMKVHKCCVTK